MVLSSICWVTFFSSNRQVETFLFPAEIHTRFCNRKHKIHAKYYEWDSLSWRQNVALCKKRNSSPWVTDLFPGRGFCRIYTGWETELLSRNLPAVASQEWISLELETAVGEAAVLKIWILNNWERRDRGKGPNTNKQPMHVVMKSLALRQEESGKTKSERQQATSARRRLISLCSDEQLE